MDIYLQATVQAILSFSNVRQVIIGVPSLLQRRSILKCVCREMPLSPDVDLNAVAEMTCGYVGADLSALSREAALQAMRVGRIADLIF